MTDSRPCETCQVVVIGGGQAGLSVGYCLARLGLSFVILEAPGRAIIGLDVIDPCGPQKFRPSPASSFKQPF